MQLSHAESQGFTEMHKGCELCISINQAVSVKDSRRMLDDANLRGQMESLNWFYSHIHLDKGS